MALKDFSGVFWVDSSSYFLTSNLTYILNQIKKTGAALLTKTHHSNFAVTNKKTFEYIPSDEILALQIQKQSGITLFYRTYQVIKNIIRWHVYCALDKQCMAPIDIKVCSWGPNPVAYYTGCHRYDQSVINILCHNFFFYCNLSYHYTDKVILQTRVTNELMFSDKN